MRASYQDGHNKNGFTIVELLIVIVVIAILAAISIIAYTGIQDRARSTAALSAAKQVADQIALYAVEHDGVYPGELEEVGIQSTGSTSYQYRVNNSNPASWCVTTTVGNKSAYASNTQTSPTEGACAGDDIGGSPANVLSSSLSRWESGHYNNTNGGKDPYGGRIRYIELIRVIPGAVYTQNVGNEAYRFVVRYYNSAQVYVSSPGAIAVGASIRIPSGVSYMSVSIYQPDNGSVSYETYQSLLQNGGIDPVIIRAS